MAIDAADISFGWYWVVDRKFLYNPSIVFVLSGGNDKMIVVHHGVENFEALSEVLERYDFIARIEMPDFRALLPKTALEIMDSAPDPEDLSWAIVDTTQDVPQDGYRRRRH